MIFTFSFCDYDTDGSLSPCDTVSFPLCCVGVLSFIRSSAFLSAWNCPAYQTSFRRLMKGFLYTSSCCKDPLSFSVFYDSFSSYLYRLRDSHDLSTRSMFSFSFNVLPGK